METKERYENVTLLEQLEKPESGEQDGPGSNYENLERDTSFQVLSITHSDKTASLGSTNADYEVINLLKSDRDISERDSLKHRTIPKASSSNSIRDEMELENIQKLRPRVEKSDARTSKKLTNAGQHFYPTPGDIKWFTLFGAVSFICVALSAFFVIDFLARTQRNHYLDVQSCHPWGKWSSCPLDVCESKVKRQRVCPSDSGRDTEEERVCNQGIPCVRTDLEHFSPKSPFSGPLFQQDQLPTVRLRDFTDNSLVNIPPRSNNDRSFLFEIGVHGGCELSGDWECVLPNCEDRIIAQVPKVVPAVSLKSWIKRLDTKCHRPVWAKRKIGTWSAFGRCQARMGTLVRYRKLLDPTGKPLVQWTEGIDEGSSKCVHCIGVLEAREPFNYSANGNKFLYRTFYSETGGNFFSPSTKLVRAGPGEKLYCEDQLRDKYGGRELETLWEPREPLGCLLDRPSGHLMSTYIVRLRLADPKARYDFENTKLCSRVTTSRQCRIDHQFSFCPECRFERMTECLPASPYLPCTPICKRSLYTASPTYDYSLKCNGSKIVNCEWGATICVKDCSNKNKAICLQKSEKCEPNTFQCQDNLSKETRNCTLNSKGADYEVCIGEACLWGFKEKRSWTQAQEDCASNLTAGNHLISPSGISKEILTGMEGMMLTMKEDGIDSTWIGLRCMNGTLISTGDEASSLHSLPDFIKGQKPNCTEDLLMSLGHDERDKNLILQAELPASASKKAYICQSPPRNEELSLPIPSS